MTDDLDDKRKAGQQPHKPTDESRAEAELLSGYGVLQEDIAALLSISVPTLLKYYRKELDAGKAKANAAVGKTLFQKATDGDIAAAIWWSKSQMRWKETTKVEHSGELNVKIPTSRAIDIAREVLGGDA